MSSLFDAIIVGTGNGTLPLAETLSAAGWKIAVIECEVTERARFDTGLTPIKSLLASAQVAHYNRRAEDFGIVPSIAVMVDMVSVKRRMRSITDAGREKVEARLRNLAGCSLYEGRTQFISPSEIRVGTTHLRASNILLNVGSHPSIGNFHLSSLPCFTSSTILDLDEIPQRLVIIGGGLTGLEFAQMYRRFGADITLVEKSPRLLPQEDRDASLAIQGILEAEGIKMYLNTECTELRATEMGAKVVVISADREAAIDASHVLLTIGRSPNTSDLAIENAGIRLTEGGYIPVDAHLRSEVSGIWAIGECNGRGTLNDLSFNDSEVAAANLRGDKECPVAVRIPAHILFTDPPLAQVGMTEEQVREIDSAALIGLSHMNRVENAVQKSETEGFIKILVDATSKQILGATVLGRNADEAIHCVLTAMELGVSSEMLKRSMHSHPTLAQLIPIMLGELRPLV